jgi:hypothetical protein
MVFTKEERRALVALAGLLILGQAASLWQEHRRSRPDRELSAWLARIQVARGDSVRGMAPPPAHEDAAGMSQARVEEPEPGPERERDAGRAGPEHISAGLPAGFLESGRIRINQAGEADLELLPGVGPALARKIREERERGGPFLKPEDLLRVPGIGPRKLELLRPQVDWSRAPGESARTGC